MLIMAAFHRNNVAATDLTPSISITEVPGAEVVSDLMDHNGAGVYYYDFASFDADKEYFFAIDGGDATLDARYLRGASGQAGEVSHLDADISSRAEPSDVQLSVAYPALVPEETPTGTIAARRGDAWSIAVTGLGTLTGATKLWFTIKESERQTDAKAIVQIELSEGLITLNAEAALTPANGSITIDDGAAGDITVSLAGEETALIALKNYVYDIQALIGGDPTTVQYGQFRVTADITRATS